LRKLDRQVEVELTRGVGHATALAAQAVRERYPLVVAAGGDGTLNEVLQPLVGTGVGLGVLALGTVNLWARETCAPANPEALAELLDRGPFRWVDVGQAGSRYFLLMAGLGFDAAVVAGLSTALKRRLGRAAYALAAARLAPFYRGSRIRLRLDGHEERMTALLVLVSNTRRYGGNWQAIPHAVADDGLLDVLVIRGERFWTGVPQVGALLGGARRRHAVFQKRAAEIVVEAERMLPMQVDGDGAGLPAATRIVTVPRALRVLVAENPYGLFGAFDE
ncbi:MAG: diacylglycerol/lipid kinase family protein, partial [Chloroflexota bacterium]